MKADLRWIHNMAFECNNHGIKTFTDATLDTGGEDKGPTPKELVLNAMMGCTAMDVVSILKKMRQEIKEFKMDIEAEKTTEHPTHFKTALINYYLTGELDAEKVKKAVDSSLTKYCGVNYMISFTCDINFKVIVNQVEIHSGKVNFNQK
ncbi:MAG: OsmC family protein [Bacteriovoracaceae bacterium]